MALGALLVVVSLIWLALLVLAWLDPASTGSRGTGPLALASAGSLVDIALTGNLGRWWMTPRWPGRPRHGWLAPWTDPLGLVLPLVTAATLVANAVLSTLGGMTWLDWISIALCLAGLVMLAGVRRTTPAPVHGEPR